MRGGRISETDQILLYQAINISNARTLTMPPKIDIEEVRRPIKKELEPLNEKLASLEEKYNTLSQTADFASALKLSTIKYLNS